MESIHLWLHYDGRYCTVLIRNVKSKIIYDVAVRFLDSSANPNSDAAPCIIKLPP